MLSKKQKTLLENQIYKLLKESMFENNFGENVYGENFYQEDAKKKKKRIETKHHDDDEHFEHKKHHEHDDDRNETGKRESVMKWLDSAQELHSVLSYELWPGKDEDTARSLFSKKYRGEDNEGKHYEFSPEEINSLYNLRGDFISDAGLD